MKKSLLLLFPLITAICVGQGIWSPKANFSAGTRYGAFYFSIGSKGYVGTGTDDTSPYKTDLWEYDAHSGVWTQLADFAGGVRSYAIGFSVGSKGYAGTGISASYSWKDDMWEYDPASNTWAIKDTFPAGPRYHFAAFTVGTKAYLGTGEYREGPWTNSTYYNDFWEFDPAAAPTHQWTQKADVPLQGRTAARGFSIGSKGYIGFGVYYYDTRMNDLWEYDPPTDTWTRKADLPAEGRYQPALFSLGTKGYVVGGHFYSGLKDVWEFDPAAPDATAWTRLEDFPGEPRSFAVGMTIGETAYVGLGTNGAVPLGDWWSYALPPPPDSIPPVVVCPPAQNLCYQAGNIYTIPLLVASDNVGIETINYSISGSTIRNGTGPNASGLFNPGTSTIQWRVTDGAGNTSICSMTVKVYPRFTASIADSYPLLIRGKVNTLYIGLGPTCAPLLAVPSGGTPYPGLNPYRYSWSNGGNAIATLVCPPMVAGSYNYTVTITDAAGCSVTATKTIHVVDARCGPKKDEVLICWFGSSQSCYKKWQAALVLLYGVGAQVGPCDNLKTTDVPAQMQGKQIQEGPLNSITVYPNPSPNGFTLNVRSEAIGDIVVMVYDGVGQLMDQFKGPANGQYKFGERYRAGVYLVEVRQGITRTVVKVVKM